MPTSWADGWRRVPDRFRLLVGLFALGLGARMVVLAVGHASIQSWEYETLAQSIISGHGYVIMHFGRLAFAFGDGNLYSFLAGAVYLALGHKLLALAFVQALVGSLIGPLLFAIGERPLGTRVAALGGMLGELHPGLLAYTLKLHPLGLDAVLLAALVLWLQRTRQDAHPAMATGVALGLNLMTRPTFFVAGLVAMIVRWRRHQSAARPLMLAALVALAVALPWVGRNWAVLGRPVFTSTALEDVWKGTNPRASGAGLLASGRDALSLVPQSMRNRMTTLDELDRSTIFGQLVVEFATQKPKAFAALVARKFFYFWWSSPQMGVLYPVAWLDAYLIYAGIILGCGLLGAVSIARSTNADARALLGTIVAVSLSIAVLHALSYVEGRHRWGVEPLLLLLTAQGAVRVATGWAQRRGRKRAIERSVTARNASSTNA